MSDLEFTFTAKLWLWSGKGAWHFVTVPEEISGQIKMLTQRRGFGSARVSACIGESHWKTSVFPDAKSGCYFLPVKAEIRKRCNIKEGDNIAVALNLDVEL
jgi:Domain of unknown function (DUF1905)